MAGDTCRAAGNARRLAECVSGVALGRLWVLARSTAPTAAFLGQAAHIPGCHTQLRHGETPGQTRWNAGLLLGDFHQCDIPPVQLEVKTINIDERSCFLLLNFPSGNVPRPGWATGRLSALRLPLGPAGRPRTPPTSVGQEDTAPRCQEGTCDVSTSCPQASEHSVGTQVFVQ